MVAGALSLRQSLAMRIRPGETSEVAAFAKSLAGDEKTSDRSAGPHRDRWGRRTLHRLWRILCALLRFGLLIARGKNGRRAQRTGKAENRTRSAEFGHGPLSPDWLNFTGSKPASTLRGYPVT
jgi:hypothetical protein